MVRLGQSSSLRGKAECMLICPAVSELIPWASGKGNRESRESQLVSKVDSDRLWDLFSWMGLRP